MSKSQWCFITYDAGGSDCASVDYVVNEEVCKRCTENKRFKQFVSETAIESVERSYNLQLTRGVLELMNTWQQTSY